MIIKSDVDSNVHVFVLAQLFVYRGPVTETKNDNLENKMNIFSFFFQMMILGLLP